MVASGTLPPFSSRTSPCTVAVVICAWPQLEAQASKDKSTNTTSPHDFMSFPPDSIPIRSANFFNGLAKTADEAGESLGHKYREQQVHVCGNFKGHGSRISIEG